MVAAVSEVDSACWACRLSAKLTPGALAVPDWAFPWEERVLANTRATRTAAITKLAMVATMVKPASVRRPES